ncbi:HSP90 family protein [Phycicoccus duodecadis]|uniref:Molecular chaperone HtpG n=1 Tax=Phycicoccus duodecadis TaxID=173053 RepID=A0A2N3YN09_9MICO|nr:HSP90 family protein [Phycicoccus duodecadis]PKW28214.1 molecular chaperone HtpG [Phycicoccus duodecadis]
MAEADEVFHVDLRGVVDLLSHHLYSSPRVYLRELVQNAVDASTARREHDPSAPATVRVVPADVSADGRLHVVDAGIGLDEHGVRTALSTIGASTKRDALGMARDSYLGRFGIGLLSCFLVTDEIAVETETAGAAHAVRWRGRDDGGYTLERTTARGTPGTTVSLAPRGSAAELLRAASVLRLVATYARHLDVDLVVETADGPVRCARARFPWEEADGAPLLGRAAAWCQDVLGFAPLDVVPLADPATGLRGYAYVVPTASAARPTARVYAQRMLVTENDHDLLPPWATFVRAVVDVSGLGLTASREALRTDATLDAVRDRLGAQLRTWLLRMAATDRPRAQAFFAVHHLGAKAMAAQDDAMLDVVADVLPWETTTGTATLTEFAAQQRIITYVDTLEHFRQVATVAAAQGIPVLNAGYAYDAAIVERFVARTPGAESRRMPPEELTTHVDRLDADAEAVFLPLLDVARAVLARAEAEPIVRRFRPESLQAMLLVGDAAERDRDRRSVADLAGLADGPWGAALASLADPTAAGPAFVLNAANPSVRRLAGADPTLQRLALEALYAHALLAGGHPRTPFDSALLARALPALIDHVITGGG